MNNTNTPNTNDKTFLIILGLVCMCCMLFTLAASVALVVISTKEDDESPSSPSPSPSPTPSSVTEIPHQIKSGTDEWCVNDGKTVHQDVPECGRICSSWEYVGSKNKDTWGLWGDDQNGIDCPEAKLDQVWKLTGGMGGENKPNRELAFGEYSSDTTGNDNANPTEQYCIANTDIPEYVDGGSCKKRTDTGYTEYQYWCDPYTTQNECENGTIDYWDDQWPSSDSCYWDPSRIKVSDYCTEKVKDAQGSEKEVCQTPRLKHNGKNVCRYG